MPPGSWSRSSRSFPLPAGRNPAGTAPPPSQSADLARLASPPATSQRPTACPPATPAPPVDAAARAEVDRLQAAVAADPADPDAQRELGQALLQLIRETLDPSLYEPAEHALREADRLRPDDGRTLTALGALQLGRHQFADALRDGPPRGAAVARR